MAKISRSAVSRSSGRPVSIMALIAASTARRFIDMKSTSVLSRSKTIARIMPAPPPVSGGRLFERLADRSADRDLAVVDADVEPAVGVAADPGLVPDRGPLPPVVRQGDQNALLALQTLWELRLRHRRPPLPLTQRYVLVDLPPQG